MDHLDSDWSALSMFNSSANLKVSAVGTEGWGWLGRVSGVSFSVKVDYSFK